MSGPGPRPDIVYRFPGPKPEKLADRPDPKPKKISGEKKKEVE